MDDSLIYVHEREVEAARNKLAKDLALLRSPATYQAFTRDVKADAVNLKDELVENARDKVQSTYTNFVDEMKARAAANPAAVLAIGAGIAWQLVRRPPIATALVGLGLYGLFTTPASGQRHRSNQGYLAQAKGRLQEQVEEVAVAAKDKALEVASTAAEKVSELTSDLTEQVSAKAKSAADHVEDLASKAADHVTEWSSGARRALHDDTDRISSSAQQPAGLPSGAQRESWSPSLQPDQGSRDTLLLGLAGAAVTGALAIAVQRRVSEDE